MTDSLAVFRNRLGPELSKLAENHMQADLKQSDRDALQKAASTVTTHASVGSALGLAVAMLFAFRLRAGRRAMFRTFRTAEKPQAIRFADGREEMLPDLAPLLRPSRLGDIATYTLLGAGGVFFGGEIGLLTGTFRARQHIAQDRESSERIQNAFKRFQADALRTQANLLEQSANGSDSLDGSWSL